MFKDMLSLICSRSNYKNKQKKDMKPDKLFNVSLKIDFDTKLGIVKAEDMASALQYLEKEYPNWHIDSIDESPRTIL